MDGESSAHGRVHSALAEICPHHQIYWPVLVAHFQVVYMVGMVKWLVSSRMPLGQRWVMVFMRV